jgi:arginase
MAKPTRVQIVSAPSILGLRPSGVENLSATLLSNGLAAALHTHDTIEVQTYNHAYSPERSSESRILNDNYLHRFSVELCTAMEKVFSTDSFALVLGGDCSILLGIMSALKSRGTHGLFFFDAHADFYEPEHSLTGEAADMELGFITGRGPALLTDVNSARPYVQDNHVIHIGQRDMEETVKYKSREIRDTAIRRFDLPFIKQHGVTQTWAALDQYASQLNLNGFWIHFDTDVLNDEINPAVDYRLPGGLTFEECNYLMKKLIGKYPVKGMSVTIFNPSLDAGQKIAKQLSTFVSDVLR